MGFIYTVAVYVYVNTAMQSYLSLYLYTINARHVNNHKKSWESYVKDSILLNSVEIVSDFVEIL